MCIRDSTHTHTCNSIYRKIILRKLLALLSSEVDGEKVGHRCLGGVFARLVSEEREFHELAAKQENERSPLVLPETLHLLQYLWLCRRISGQSVCGSNSKQWFTTSFLQGGRCRKAMVGVCVRASPAERRDLDGRCSCGRWKSEDAASKTINNCVRKEGEQLCRRSWFNRTFLVLFIEVDPEILHYTSEKVRQTGREVLTDTRQFAVYSGLDR